MVKKRGRVKWMIPQLQDEIENIMKVNNFTGHGAESLAQVKATEYCKVGRQVEKAYEKMTMGLYKDRRKKKDLMRLI